MITTKHTVTPVMSIAGSDCSAGAGLQADLKTFQHFHLHGLTVVTSIVSETANLVRRVEPVSVEMMEDQTRLLLQSFPLTTAKTGMLGTAAHVAKIAEIFTAHKHIQLVIDPVMVASTGASLITDDAIHTYREKLLPLATIITPNLPEAEVLLARKITSLHEMETAALQLSKQYHCAVLLKGGHLPGSQCTDILAENGTTHQLSTPRLPTLASHGTGCTLAAAIAANLALNHPISQATTIAKNYLNQTLNHSYSFTSPNGQTLHALNQGTTIPQNPS